MSSSFIIRYFNPWRFRREEQARRLDELRRRDGDHCRRCRRPVRFDLPDGHDQAPSLEQVLARAEGGTMALDNFVLTHVRCHAVGADHTSEVTERSRRKSEAALLAKPRRKRAKAA
jgi:hypothetical protein